MCEIKLEMRGKAQHVARLAQTRMQNSGVTETKFIKLLSDADGSLAVLTHASVLRSSHPLWRQLPVFCEWMTTVSHHHGGSYLYVLGMNESSEPLSRRQLPVCFWNEREQRAVVVAWELHLCQIVNEEVDLSGDRLQTLVDHSVHQTVTSQPSLLVPATSLHHATATAATSICTPDSHIPAISLSPHYLTPPRYYYYCCIYLYTRQSHPSHHY